MLTVSYGPLTEQVVDVRLPAGSGPAPLVVVVHGGFWKAEWDREHAGPQSDGLAAAGYVVATIEYRRTGMPGGGWPGTLDDVAAAVDAVPALVAEAAPGRADGSTCVLVGHSAGGHLALWAASRHRLPPSSPWHRPSPAPVRGVVALAGMGDLVDVADRGLGGGAAPAFLGGSPAELPARYDAASPAVRLPLGVPVALVHGTDDVQVPAACSTAYADLASAAGDDVRLHLLDGVDHFALIEPGSVAWPAVLAALAEVAGTA